MPLNLHEHLSFSAEEILKIENKEFPPKFFIETNRSGLRRRVSSEHGTAIQKHYDTLISHYEIYNPLSDRIEINYEEAVKYSGWMDADYTLPALIRIKLSLNPDYAIPQPVRWALQIYETTIKRQGAIKGSMGHTILPLPLLLAQIASECPLGWQEHHKLHEEDKDGIRYTLSQAQNLLDQFVEEGYLAYTEDKTSIYVPEYAEIETSLLRYLSMPKMPETLENLPEFLDEDQKIAVRDLVQRTTVGGVLAGYPGTGKTFACSIMCDYYGLKNVLALATTGAATMVLSRQLKCEAYTISSAFYNSGNESFIKKWKRPVYIVDECSMLNMSFLRQLQRLLTLFAPTTVILVGDPAQLPPVGAGAFFEAIVTQKIQTPIPIKILSVPHRMAPESAARLQQFNGSVSHKAAAESIYPLKHTPPISNDTENWPLQTILKFCLGGARTKDKTITDRNMADVDDRLLLSTYRNNDAKILNLFLESFRCQSLSEVSFLRGQLEADINKYIAFISAQNIEEFPRKLAKPTRNYAHKYVANFLLNNIDKMKSEYNDDLEKIENAITTNYRALRERLAPALFTKGSYLRCKINGWFKFWAAKRVVAMEQKWGVYVRDKESIANGQIFVAIEDNVLYCAESTVTVEIRDRDKASHLFYSSWVSTTHKLQGDQGAISILFLLNTSIENKLVYVAKSRGKTDNIIVQNVTSSEGGWMSNTVRCAASVERLSVAAHLSDQKIKAAA